MSRADFDDVLILDDTGDAPFNALVGDRCLRWFPVVEDGAVNQWTQSGGTGGLHYTAVNDATPDGDPTRLQSSTIGFEEEFQLADISALDLDTIGVIVNATVRKTDAGARSIQLGLRLGEDIVYSGNILVQDNYSVKQAMFPLAPDGGAWTLEKYNATKVRIKDAA